MTITNNSVEPVTIGALTDTQSGGATDFSSCNPGLINGGLAVGASTSCQYTVTYPTSGSYPNTAEVTVLDNDGQGVGSSSVATSATSVTVQAPVSNGRMTGGGSIPAVDTNRKGQKMSHGFELHCDRTKLPNTLEVNDSKNNKFHMEVLTSGACSDNPALTQAPPQAWFDTYKGTGTGRYNGTAGYTVEFTFTDAGEPGSKDNANIVVRKGAVGIGTIVQNLSTNGAGYLKNGNQQAHN